MEQEIDFVTLDAEKKDFISYHPQWRQITGSVLSAILLGQINYWWKHNGRRPFYKFAAPCGHPLYREGDSWQEELGFSRTEFENALEKIAVKVNRGTNKTDLLKEHLVFYWTDQNRVTYYELNTNLYNEKRRALYKIPNAGNLHYVMQETDIRKCRKPALDRSEITSEITSDITPNGVAPAAAAPNGSTEPEQTPPDAGKQVSMFPSTRAKKESKPKSITTLWLAAFKETVTAQGWLPHMGNKEKLAQALEDLQAIAPAPTPEEITAATRFLIQNTRTQNGTGWLWIDKLPDAVRALRSQQHNRKPNTAVAVSTTGDDSDGLLD